MLPFELFNHDGYNSADQTKPRPVTSPASLYDSKRLAGPGSQSLDWIIRRAYQGNTILTKLTGKRIKTSTLCGQLDNKLL